MLRRAWLPLMIAGAIAVALGGCGDDGGGSSEATEPAVDEAAQQEAAEAAREKRLAAEVRRLIPIASTSQMGKSRKEQLRIARAEGQLWVIAGKSLDAVRPLLRTLKERDYELIGSLDGFYIALGKPGSQQILADTVGELYPSGDPRWGGLPFEMLGAGNAKLTRLVTEELESLGYTVSGGSGFTGVQWGTSGAYGNAPIAPGVPAPPTAPPPSP